MTSEKTTSRRRYSREFKAQVMAECDVPGASVANGSATAKAIDYSLKRWEALTRFIDDGHLPADNNRAENLINPIAIGRSNWLFAGSLRSGQRAAAVMSLLHSAKLNGLEAIRLF